MTQPLKGVRILEVAQFTFVPSAGAVLADWGAEVLKIENAETGDAQRGLFRVLGLDAASKGSSFFPIIEGPNRGKRSVGVALNTQEGRDVIYELAKHCDVFLTNYLPSARKKLGIDLEDIRKANPNIIFVRGSGFGDQGPERDKGGFDSTGFWARSGTADALTNPEQESITNMPTGAFGDNIGGMTIAGGISAALYKRLATGETSELDISLLSVGAWVTQFGSNLAMLVGGPLPKPSAAPVDAPTNPLSVTYKTSDSRFITLTMLQPGRYFADFCTVVGLPELVTDERFLTAESIFANGAQAKAIIAAYFKTKTYAEWLALLPGIQGQWAAVQNFWELSQDVQLRANGLVAKVIDSDGIERELIASPVTFDNVNPELTRAPQFAEHTDEVLLEYGYTMEQILELKIAGALT